MKKRASTLRSQHDEHSADAMCVFPLWKVFHNGKTHLSVAVGMACVEAGRPVRFFTAAELVLALTRANREHNLEALLKDISKCDLLIIDELGYVPLDVEGARLLFQVMSDCYERRPAI